MIRPPIGWADGEDWWESLAYAVVGSFLFMMLVVGYCCIGRMAEKSPW